MFCFSLKSPQWSKQALFQRDFPSDWLPALPPQLPSLPLGRAKQSHPEKAKGLLMEAAIPGSVLLIPVHGQTQMLALQDLGGSNWDASFPIFLWDQI